MNREGEKLLDELHCRISELKIRVSKLEQYARLQEDLNRATVHYIHDKKPNFSVIKNNVFGMSFEEAMAWYKHNKSIRRKSWERGVFMSLKLCCEFSQFSRDDIMAIDWEMLE